jgi:hypothetical protein
MKIDHFELAQLFLGAATFFITRFLAFASQIRKEWSDLKEEHGKFKMVNEAQWKNIDDLKKRVENLEKKGNL